MHVVLIEINSVNFARCLKTCRLYCSFKCVWKKERDKNLEIEGKKKTSKNINSAILIIGNNLHFGL